MHTWRHAAAEPHRWSPKVCTGSTKCSPKTIASSCQVLELRNPTYTYSSGCRHSTNTRDTGDTQAKREQGMTHKTGSPECCTVRGKTAGRLWVMQGRCASCSPMGWHPCAHSTTHSNTRSHTLEPCRPARQRSKLVTAQHVSACHWHRMNTLCGTSTHSTHVRCAETTAAGHAQDASRHPQCLPLL